jgi:hypothetical protein
MNGVMSMRGTRGQAQASGGVAAPAPRVPAPVQSRAHAAAGPITPAGMRLARESLAGPGVPLDQRIRAEAEGRIGHDFSQVRVHTGPEVRLAGIALGARGYAIGNDVALPRHGRLRGADERALVLHELVHVAQQANAMAGDAPQSSPADAEAEAQRAETAPPGVALPVAAAMSKGLGCSREDWLQSTPDLSQYNFSDVVQDIDEIEEWISRQTTSSPEMDRMNEALGTLRKELAQRQGGVRKAAKAPAKAKGKRKDGAKAGDGPEPASAESMPRILRERSSIQYDSPEEARAEVDRIVAWLQRSDLSRADRSTLQLELEGLAPQFEQTRQKRAQERRSQAIAHALAPTAGLADANAQVLDSLSRVDGIVPLADRPGFFALMRGSEQIVMAGEEVAKLRAGVEKSLTDAARRARSLNEMTFGRLNDHMKLNYEDQPYVGFAVSLVSGEEPVELYDRVLPMVQTSNMALTRFQKQAAGAPFAQRAAVLLDAVQEAERARVQLDEGVERAMSAAGDIVTGLTVTRDLAFAISLSLGAIVAAPVVAAGVGGLGATGAVGVVATGVGTGTVVGAGGFALRGSAAVGGELLAGHSMDEALSAGWKEGKRGAKEGAVSGFGGGVGFSTGRALGLGAQQLTRAQTITRSIAAGSAGGGSSELARGVIEQRGVVDTLKGTGKGLVLGGGGGLIGGASSTIASPVLRQTAAIGGDAALNAGVAYAETGNLRDAALAGVSSIAVSGGTAAARHSPPGTSAGERWAANAGQSVRRQTRNVVAAAMLGTARVPAFRGTGAAAGAIIAEPIPGRPTVAEAATTPSRATEEAPVKPSDAADQQTAPAAVAAENAVATTRATNTEEVFAEISAELGLTASTQAAQPGVRGTVADAQAGGLIGPQGQPGTVDAAFQSHGSASDVRAQYGVTGAQQQSAHVNATAFLKDTPNYSREAAPTLLLDPATHRAFDNQWKQWAIAQRRAGRTECTIGEMRRVMHAAIDNIPNMPPRVKGALAWQLDLEIQSLGLADSLPIALPYSNVKPTP